LALELKLIIQPQAAEESACRENMSCKAKKDTWILGENIASGDQDSSQTLYSLSADINAGWSSLEAIR